MARLRKADVEALLGAYDADPVAALTVALRRALDQPDASWPALVAALPEERQDGLLAQDPASLDRLAAELNELRALPVDPPTRA